MFFVLAREQFLLYLFWPGCAAARCSCTFEAKLVGLSHVAFFKVAVRVPNSSCTPFTPLKLTVRWELGIRRGFHDLPHALCARGYGRERNHGTKR